MTGAVSGGRRGGAAGRINWRNTREPQEENVEKKEQKNEAKGRVDIGGKYE